MTWLENTHIDIKICTEYKRHTKKEGDNFHKMSQLSVSLLFVFWLINFVWKTLEINHSAGITLVGRLLKMEREAYEPLGSTITNLLSNRMYISKRIL
jgi:hypothetical protein